MKRFGLLLLCLILCLAVSAQETISLVGCGSVIPKGLYGVWANAYMQRNPLVRITYLPYGSKEGIKQIPEGSADFGGGDIPATKKELRTTGKSLLPLSLCLTPRFPVSNVPGTTRPLCFS